MQITEAMCPTQYSWVMNIVDPVVQLHKGTGVMISHREIIVPASLVDKRAKGSTSFPMAIAGDFSSRENGTKSTKEVSEEPNIQKMCPRSQLPPPTGFDAPVCEKLFFFEM